MGEDHGVSRSRSQTSAENTPADGPSTLRHIEGSGRFDGKRSGPLRPAQETAPLEVVRYDAHTGLVPVIVQDAGSGEVLMQAYADREALKRTLGTGEAWFWSRSRRSYWHKGDTSGHVQRIREVRVDCDGDSVLYLVDPAGPACHTGAPSCFYRTVRHGAANEGAVPDKTESAPAPGAMATGADGPQAAEAARDAGERDAAATGAPSYALENPGELGDAMDGVDVLRRLWDVIDRRWRERPAGSYTTYLFTQGVDKIAKKVGEEAVETALAAKNAVSGPEGRMELARESADLLYHLLALWRSVGLQPADVWAELNARSRG
jgi:phosphoribosyl-ATP pyrophosphohydrolase/phosphoribosyl-AMP cyclohydrolase